MTYVQHLSNSNTPQTEPVSDNQVLNSAGGYTFQLDYFARLERFLILGCEGGTYYTSERKLTRENAKCVQLALESDYNRTIDLIVEISVNNRAIKNDAAIFALAIATSYPLSSKKALGSLSKVCRIGTHLFQFVDAVNELRGWGKGLRSAVSNWYLDKSPDRLAMQVTKYAQRNGWSHRDVLRLAHPKTDDSQLNDVLRYVTQHDKWASEGHVSSVFLSTVDHVKTGAMTVNEMVNLIHEHGLVREHLPTEALNEIKIWEALLENMPATAMLRNLGKMSSIGLLNPLSEASNKVVSRLTDVDFVRRGRLHPFALLNTLVNYEIGQGFRGNLSWNANANIVSALDVAFQNSFGELTPTNKRFLLGVDVSGSMTWNNISNSNVTCAAAAACMAMVACRVEPQSHVFGFQGRFVDLGVLPGDSLSETVKKTSDLPFGSTNCALPMTYALENKIPVDAFCVYTDNETHEGRNHPHVALEEYRNAMGIDAKLIVFGMTATDFSIANPEDPGMLDVVGFDSSAPKVMEEFVK